jgi:hypothetical protein
MMDGNRPTTGTRTMTRLPLAALVAVAAGCAQADPRPARPAGEVNVQDFGADGTGDPDRDTKAFADAVADAARRPGTALRVPPGRYVLTRTLELENLTLVGTAEGAWGANAGERAFPTLVAGMAGGTPCVRLRDGGGVHGLRIECSAAHRDARGTAVEIAGAGCRASCLRIDDAYIGIGSGGGTERSLAEVGRSVVEKCFVVRAREAGVSFGTSFSRAQDASWVSKVEVWNDSDKGPANPGFRTRVGFRFGHVDALMVTDCLAYHCDRGYQLHQYNYPKVPPRGVTGRTWGTFANCVSDNCSTGFDAYGNHTVSITGGSHWAHHIALNVQEPPGQGGTAQVRLAAVELSSNGLPPVRVIRAKTVSLSGCQIRRTPDDPKQGGPLVHVENDTPVTLTGCVFHFKPFPGLTIQSGQSNAVRFGDCVEVRE